MVAACEAASKAASLHVDLFSIDCAPLLPTLNGCVPVMHWGDIELTSGADAGRPLLQLTRCSSQGNITCASSCSIAFRAKVAAPAQACIARSSR